MRRCLRSGLTELFLPAARQTAGTSGWYLGPPPHGSNPIFGRLGAGRVIYMTLHDTLVSEKGAFLSFPGFYSDTRQECVFPCVLPVKKRAWLGAESNRRHVDFQSTALPTELPSRMLKIGNHPRRSRAFTMPDSDC